MMHFLSALSRVSKLKVGDPKAPDTMIGPVINEAQLNGLRRRIQNASLRVRGQVPAGKRRALFCLLTYSPT